MAKNETKIKRMKQKLEETEGAVTEAGNEVNLVDELRKRDEAKLEQYERALKKSLDLLAVITEKIPEITQKMNDSKSRIQVLGNTETVLSEEIGDLNNELNGLEGKVKECERKIHDLKDSKQLFRQQLERLMGGGSNRVIKDAVDLMDYLDREKEALQQSGRLKGQEAHLCGHIARWDHMGRNPLPRHRWLHHTYPPQPYPALSYPAFPDLSSFSQHCGRRHIRPCGPVREDQGPRERRDHGEVLRDAEVVNMMTVVFSLTSPTDRSAMPLACLSRGGVCSRV